MSKKTYFKAILIPIDYYHTLIRKQCPRKATILENILKDSAMSPATTISHVNNLLTQQRTRRQPGPVKKKPLLNVKYQTKPRVMLFHLN